MEREGESNKGENKNLLAKKEGMEMPSVYWKMN